MSNTLELVQDFLMPLGSEPYFLKLYEQINRQINVDKKAKEQYDRIQKLGEKITFSDESLQLSKRLLTRENPHQLIPIDEEFPEELHLLFSTIFLRGEKKMQNNPEIIINISKKLDEVADNFDFFIQEHPSFFDELLVETSVKYAKDATFAQEINKSGNYLKKAMPTLDSFSRQTNHRSTKEKELCRYNGKQISKLACVLIGVSIVVIAIIEIVNKKDN